MARYTAGGKALATAASGNLISIRSAAQQRARISEIHVFSEAATALNLAAYLTTVVDTAGTAVAGQKEDSGAGTPNVVVSTIPTGGTKAAVAMRRAFLPAVAGSAMIWTWQPGNELLVPLSLSLLIVNDAASVGPAITWQVVWEE